MKMANIDRALTRNPKSRVDVSLIGSGASLVEDGEGTVDDRTTGGWVVDMVVNV